MAELAARIRARYPKEFDDWQDDELEQSFLEKYPDTPVYAELAGEKARIAFHNSQAARAKAPAADPSAAKPGSGGVLAPGFKMAMEAPAFAGNVVAGVPQGLAKMGTSVTEAVAAPARLLMRDQARRHGGQELPPELESRVRAEEGQTAMEALIAEDRKRNPEKWVEIDKTRAASGLPATAVKRKLDRGTVDYLRNPQLHVLEKMEEDVQGYRSAIDTQKPVFEGAGAETAQKIGELAPILAAGVLAPVPTAAALAGGHVGAKVGEALAPTVAEATGDPEERVSRILQETGSNVGMFGSVAAVPKSLHLSIPEIADAAGSVSRLVDATKAESGMFAQPKAKTAPAAKAKTPVDAAQNKPTGAHGAVDTALGYVKEHGVQMAGELAGSTAAGIAVRASGLGWVPGLGWIVRRMAGTVGRRVGKAIDAERAAAAVTENKPTGAVGASDPAVTPRRSSTSGTRPAPSMTIPVTPEQASGMAGKTTTTSLGRVEAPPASTTMVPGQTTSAGQMTATVPKPPGLQGEAGAALERQFASVREGETGLPVEIPTRTGPEQLELPLETAPKRQIDTAAMAPESAPAPPVAPVAASDRPVIASEPAAPVAPSAPAPAPANAMEALLAEQARLEKPAGTQVTPEQARHLTKGQQARVEGANLLDQMERIFREEQARTGKTEAPPPEPARPAVVENKLPDEMARQQALAAKAQERQAAREKEPGYTERKAGLQADPLFKETFDKMVADGFPDKTARAAAYKAVESKQAAAKAAKDAESLKTDLEKSVAEATAAVEGKNLPKEVSDARDALPAVPEGHTRLWRVEGKSAVEAGGAGGKKGSNWYEENLGAYVTDKTKAGDVRYVDVPNERLRQLKADPNATEVRLPEGYVAQSKPIAEAPVPKPKPKATEPPAPLLKKQEGAAPSLEKGKVYKVGDQLPNGKYVLDVDSAGRVVEVGKNKPGGEIGGELPEPKARVSEETKPRTHEESRSGLDKGAQDALDRAENLIRTASDEVVGHLRDVAAPGSSTLHYGGSRAPEGYQGYTYHPQGVKGSSQAVWVNDLVGAAEESSSLKAFADKVVNNFKHEIGEHSGGKVHGTVKNDAQGSFYLNSDGVKVYVSKDAAKPGSRGGAAKGREGHPEEFSTQIQRDILEHNPAIADAANRLHTAIMNTPEIYYGLKGGSERAQFKAGGKMSADVGIGGELPKGKEIASKFAKISESTKPAHASSETFRAPQAVKEMGRLMKESREAKGVEYGREAEARAAGEQGGQGGTSGKVGSDGGPQHVVPKASRGRNLEGLPEEVEVGGVKKVFSAFKPAQDAAAAYMKRKGLKYDPPKKYAPVDRDRAVRIADEFDKMKHEPDHPEVKAAYDAMIKETLEQYDAMLETGLKVEFIDGPDPYGGNPRLAMEDVYNNNHLYVFPTETGFGSDVAFTATGNPLLAPTKHKISGRTATANDIFRAVHDYYGHIKEGVGFRAIGEENAWRSHSSMYTPLARRAMTVETRGQNSWLNFGPFGEKNRTAKVEDTTFADQKTGLLPEWVSEEGAKDFTPEIGGELKSGKSKAKPVISYVTPEKQARNLKWEQAALEAAQGGGGRVKPPKEPANLAKPNEKGVTFGKVTPEQWVERTESLIKPGSEEWRQARHWQDDFRAIINEYFPELAEGERGTITVGITQKSESPTGGIRILLKELERLGGTKTTKSSLSDDQVASLLAGDTKITSGVGQKISDMVDAALGRTSRSWTGEGGSLQPAPIDRHAVTDVGFVSETTNRRDLGSKFVEDVKGDVPSDAQYLYSLKFYNDLAKKFNAENYDGGGWTASQTQALGWTAIRKAIGLEPQGPRQMIENNIRRVLAEVTGFAPDSPLGKMVSKAAPDMPPELSTKITREVAPELVNRIAKATNVRVVETTVGQGGYEGGVNANVSVKLLGSKEAVADFMNGFGKVANQTEVISLRPLASAKEPGVTFGVKGAVEDPVSIWKRAVEIERDHYGDKDLFGATSGETYLDKLGFTKIGNQDGTTSIIVTRGKGVSPKDWKIAKQRLANAMSEAIRERIKQDPDVVEVNYESMSAFNDWAQSAKGQSFDAALKGRKKGLDSELSAISKWFEGQVRDRIERKKKPGNPIGGELKASGPRSPRSSTGDAIRKIEDAKKPRRPVKGALEHLVDLKPRLAPKESAPLAKFVREE